MVFAILSRVVWGGPGEMVSTEQRPAGREGGGAMTSLGAELQTKGPGSGKIPRQAQAWCVQGAATVSLSLI